MKKRIPLKMTASEWLWLGVLLCVIALSCVTTWAHTTQIIDSDSAAELVLAHHLHENGGILSKDWCYSTELRVLYIQLVFAPLFSLFEDWQMVRYVGTLILHALMLAGWGYLVKQARLNRKAFFIGSALLLMPTSVFYGSMVLYHVFYLPHITISFLITGFMLAVMTDVHRQRQKWLVWHAFALLALSFVASLGGFRQLAVTHAPLLLLAFLRMYRSRSREEGLRASLMLLCVGAAAVAGCAGLLVNMRWQETYTFQNFSGMMLISISPEKLLAMLVGMLKLFGYREGVQLTTITGLLSVAGVIVCIGCVLHSARGLLRREDPRPEGQRVLEGMLPCGLCVIVLIFVLTRQNTYAESYFIPYTVWFIPLLALMMTTQPDRAQTASLRLPAWLTAQKLAVYALCGVCMLNGLVNMRSFNQPYAFGQEYAAGMDLAPDKSSRLQPVCDYLTENGCDLVYATFWNGNVLTEMTDGQVAAVNVERKDDAWQYYDWLTLRSNRTMEARRAVLLLENSEQSLLSGTALEPLVEKAWETDGFIVYDIPDLAAFRQVFAERSNG